MERLNLLGVNVDSISEEEIYERILKLSESGQSSQIVLLNTALLIKAKLNKKLRKVINSSELVIPISNGVRFGLSFIHKKKVEIFNSFTFAIRLLSYFTDNKKVVYILGGNRKIIEKAERNIKESFPGIKLLGKYHITYKRDFEPKLITNIQKISPDLLIMSMRRGKQERWLAKNRKHFNHGAMLGVENFIDMLGGKLLSPSDKLFHSFKHSFKKTVKRPVRAIDYSLYFIFLLFNKLFKI